MFFTSIVRIETTNEKLEKALENYVWERSTSLIERYATFDLQPLSVARRLRARRGGHVLFCGSVYGRKTLAELCCSHTMGVDSARNLIFCTTNRVFSTGKQRFFTL